MELIHGRGHPAASSQRSEGRALERVAARRGGVKNEAARRRWQAGTYLIDILTSSHQALLPDLQGKAKRRALRQGKTGGRVEMRREGLPDQRAQSSRGKMLWRAWAVPVDGDLGIERQTDAVPHTEVEIYAMMSRARRSSRAASRDNHVTQPIPRPRSRCLPGYLASDPRPRLEYWNIKVRWRL